MTFQSDSNWEWCNDPGSLLYAPKILSLNFRPSRVLRFMGSLEIFKQLAACLPRKKGDLNCSGTFRGKTQKLEKWRNKYQPSIRLEKIRALMLTDLYSLLNIYGNKPSYLTVIEGLAYVKFCDSGLLEFSFLAVAVQQIIHASDNATKFVKFLRTEIYFLPVFLVKNELTSFLWCDRAIPWVW